MNADPVQPDSELALVQKDVPADPLWETSLSSFGTKFRSGEISSEAITREYCCRRAAHWLLHSCGDRCGPGICACHRCPREGWC
jgi:hypothetical protein